MPLIDEQQWRRTAKLKVVSRTFDPLTLAHAKAAVWADDPLWADRPANGGAVASWRNPYANVNLVQATSGNQPTMDDTGMNGKRAVRFTRSSTQYLTTALTLDQPFKALAVVRFATTGTLQRFLGLGNSNITRGIGILAANNWTLNCGGATNITSTGTVSANTTYVVRATVNNRYNAAGGLWVNGTMVGSGVHGSVNMTQFCIGAGLNAGTPGNAFDGWVSFMALYPGEVYDDDIEAVESALMTYYA